MDSSFSIDTINWGLSSKYQGVTGCNFNKIIVFLSLKIVFVLANSIDPGKIPHDVPFIQGLNCLHKYEYRSHLYTESLNVMHILCF